LCVIGAAAWLIVDPRRNLATSEGNASAPNSSQSDWLAASKPAGVDQRSS